MEGKNYFDIFNNFLSFFFPLAEKNELLDERRGAVFPVRRIRIDERIRIDDEIAKQQNANEYFGLQLQAMLNATIICNCYYRDRITHTPIFAYSKKFYKK